MLRIAYAQLNPTVGDLEANANGILSAWRNAEQHGAHVLVLPELALTGYPPRDLLKQPQFLRDTYASLHRVIAQVQGDTALLLGTPMAAQHAAPHTDQQPVMDGSPRYIANAAVLVLQQKIIAIHHKWLLPTYDVFDEQRYFVAGTQATVADLHGVRVGISVCEDIWNDKAFWNDDIRYAEDPISAQVAAGADILINLSASPYDVHKPAERFRLLQSVAARHKRPIVYVNQVGGNDSLLFDGRSMVIAADGHLADALPAFTESFGLIDWDHTAFDHRSFHAVVPHANTHTDTSEAGKYDDLRQALRMGIADYARKCGFRRVVVGLSGGIDSALTAALAVEALGADHVRGVAMPSPYSSKGSVDDALDLAKRLGIQCDEIRIDRLFAEFLHALEPAFVGMPNDVTEENLQARIRGVLLMAYANKFGALLLTTGNKSELAVGYCTLYGDMCGGLAVLSDVYKTQVYGLARHLNAHAESIMASTPKGTLGNTLQPPIPESSLTKAPSAELRPDQTDQQSLPSYDVLDDVLYHAIDLHLDPHTIIQQRGHEPALVRRILTMLDGAEYKRRQMAPGLRISRKAFGEGRRLPVAQKYVPVEIG